VTSASTTERLKAAAFAGALPAADAHTLEDAFALITSLRLAHQVGQLRAGKKPDKLRQPGGAQRATRPLKEASAQVASIQRRVTSELDIGAR